MLLTAAYGDKASASRSNSSVQVRRGVRHLVSAENIERATLLGLARGGVCLVTYPDRRCTGGTSQSGGTMRRCGPWMFCLCLLATVIGCDTLLNRDDCGYDPRRREADFMPLVEGNSWTYRYDYRQRNGAGWPLTRVFDSATVKLTVRSTECKSGRIVADITTEVQGTRTVWEDLPGEDEATYYPIRESGSIVITAEHANGEAEHPFLSEPFRRYHSATRDTVEISWPDQDSKRENGMVRFNRRATCDKWYLTSFRLVKDQGIERISFTCAVQFHNHAHGYYTLLDFSPGAESPKGRLAEDT